MKAVEDEREAVEKAVDTLLAQHPPASTPATEFLAARYDAGLAWVHFDVGLGGLGLPAGFQRVVNERLDAAGAPRPNANYVGIHQAAAAIHAYAGDELRHRLLRPSFTNEEFWCQLFSEPGAGSDLAGLSTAAFHDGTSWVVNGQKVWTSFAHLARWGILLARTDPTQPKHRGLTFFVLDMHAPGVEVRPLRTMDGGRHFNEVFLTDVGVPDEHRLGDVGQGWAVSMHLLGPERQGIVDNEQLGPWMLDVWRRCSAHAQSADVLRARVVEAHIADEVAKMLAERVRVTEGRAGATGMAPVLKLARNVTDQLLANVVMDVLGAEATLGGDYDWEAAGAPQSDQMRFLWTREATIGGGTSQIMRNLIGERLLGLPREPGPDRATPWNQLRRS